MASRPQQDRSIHRLLHERARSTLGVLSREDLLACELSAQASRRWVRTGKLDEIFPGAFVLPGVPRSWKQKLMCALTWAGPEAKASHRSAAALIGLDGFPEGVIEITMPSKRKPVEGIITHRVERISPHDVTKVGPIRTSTPARILLDLGAVSSFDAVECALEDALRRKLTTLPALRWELRTQGRRGVKGTATLKRLVQTRPRGYVATESRLELKIDRVLRSISLPFYARQHVIATRLGERRPDFAFPEYNFAIEADSYAHHSGRRAWERDKQRDRALRAAGWDILYVTWEDIHKRRELFVRDVYSGLHRNGWEDAPLFLD